MCVKTLFFQDNHYFLLLYIAIIIFSFHIIKMNDNVGRDSLPKSMRYANTSVNAVPSEMSLHRFDSTNGVSFSYSGSNIIRIRVKADGFIDAAKHYLEFTVTTATANAFVEGDANSFIEEMTINSNGVQIEQIQRYSLLNGIRRNYNAPLSDIIKKNVESGGGQLVEVAQADANDGKIFGIGLSDVGDFITAAESRVYCVQLHSGFLKNTFGKALPMGLNEFEIELRLKNPLGALLNDAGAPTYTISNPRIYAPVYRILNPQVLSSYAQLAGSGISWIGDTVKTYVNSIPAGTGKKVAQINDRSLSCKALVTALRNAAPEAIATYTKHGVLF